MNYDGPSRPALPEGWVWESWGKARLDLVARGTALYVHAFISYWDDPADHEIEVCVWEQGPSGRGDDWAYAPWPVIQACVEDAKRAWVGCRAARGLAVA